MFMVMVHVTAWNVNQFLYPVQWTVEGLITASIFIFILCRARPVSLTSVSKQNKKCSPNEIQRNLSDTKANPWSINVHFYDQQFNMVMSGYLYCFHYVTQKTRSPGLWQDPRINSNILIISLYVIRSPRSSRLSSSKLWVWQCPAALVLQYIMKVYLMNP